MFRARRTKILMHQRSLELPSGSSIDSLTLFDGDPTATAYTDYSTTTRVNPDYSHHKLSSIEYVDGVNDVDIKDEFIDYSINHTDLDIL